MSYLAKVLSMLGLRRRRPPVAASFAPGQSAWRDALLDEGLDARSFPVLHPERESPPREPGPADRLAEVSGDRQNGPARKTQLTAPTP